VIEIIFLNFQMYYFNAPAKAVVSSQVQE